MSGAAGGTAHGVRIDRAGERDVPGCAALYVQRASVSATDARHRFVRDLRAPDRMVFVARAARAGTTGGSAAGDRVVGYGRVSRHVSSGAEREAPSGAYLGGLMVDPAHRGRGVGTALTLARMRALFEDHGADCVWYFANARNHASLALHERLGFREVTRDFWYPGVGFDGGEGVLCRAVPATLPW